MTGEKQLDHSVAMDRGLKVGITIVVTILVSLIMADVFVGSMLLDDYAKATEREDAALVWREENMVLINRIQHPVGHGGFHTGEAITRDGKHFIWIFDCGAQSQTRISEVVKSWCAAAPAPVDWLFISHFDADHVNGVDTLMSRSTVKNVMVPYVNVEDLIVVLLHAIATDRHEQWLFDLVAEPVQFFLDRGAEHVVILGAQGPEPEGGVDIRTPVDPPEGSWDSKLIFGPTTATSSHQWPLSSHIETQPEVLEINQAGCDIKAAKDGIELLLKPYCVHVAPSLVIGMKLALLRVLGMKPSTKLSGHGPIGLGKFAYKLAEFVRTDEGRKKIRRIYETYVRSSNRSSLSLLSVPVLSSDVEIQYSATPRASAMADDFWPPWGRFMGWMNTGDAELLKPDDLRSWSDHYAPHLREIGMLALPHHGSDKNSNRDLQDRCRQALLAVHVRKGASKHPGINITTAAGTRLWRVTNNSASGVVMRLLITTGP